MELKDLLRFNDIVIQCHDNPDADALASGYVIWWYFLNNNKEARFIYRGRNKIEKSNLVMMLSELDIPVSYEPDFDEEPELLVLVDCQYGQKNVTETKAKNIAIIDHHQKTADFSDMAVIKSNVGSCSTVCWDMVTKEGLEVNENKKLATALFYGLFTDTNKLSEVSHPLDRDMADHLIINKTTITEMVNSNLSLGELKITGKAILGYKYLESNKCLVIEAEPCDPCILGVISDFSLETEGVDVCLAYYVSPNEVKFSVRSCTKEVHANELAAFLANGIGGGGGHILKAGGSIRPELLDRPATDVLAERLDEYYNSFLVIYAKETTLDVTQMKKYDKLSQSLGAVRLTDVFPAGTPINIRTLEGDVNTIIDDEAYLMIGVEGEVYPIKEDKLNKSYKRTNFVYNRTFEYEPSIKNTVTGETKHVLKYAKTVLSTGGSVIFAKPLTQPVKLFTVWAEEKYYSGTVGDYIAVRADDEHDIYVINKDIFDRLYRPI